MNNKEKIKKLIHEHVKNNIGVSFAEIDNLLEKNNIDYEGTCRIYFNPDFNLLIWIDMSNDYMNAILEMYDKEIIIQQCSILIYHVDGKIPFLKLAEKANFKYKNPRWVPCVMNIKKQRT